MTREDIIKMLHPWGWPTIAVDIAIRADFRCEYCDRDLLASVDDYDSWQVDHILPRSDNRDELWNLALACKTCNFLKRHSVPTTPIDPKADRGEAITAVRALIQERRERKQKQVDFLKLKFRSPEWPAVREAIIGAQQTLPADAAEARRYADN